MNKAGEVVTIVEKEASGLLNGMSQEDGITRGGLGAKYLLFLMAK